MPVYLKTNSTDFLFINANNDLLIVDPSGGGPTLPQSPGQNVSLGTVGISDKVALSGVKFGDSVSLGSVKG